MVGPLDKGARITGAQRSRLAATYVARYAAGESVRSIAESERRSYGFVHRLLRESGVVLRPRGGPNHRASPRGLPPE